MRKFLTDKEKEIVGLKCANCLQTEHLEYHHIIPLAIGGTNNLSNYVCLCAHCHNLLHGKETPINTLSKSELTKMGMQKAKEKGKQIGHIKGTKLVTKKSIEAKEKIIKYNKDFNGDLSNEECRKLIGIAENTFYKYKREIRAEMNNN